MLSKHHCSRGCRTIDCNSFFSLVTSHFSLTSRFFYKEPGFPVTLKLQPTYRRVNEGSHDKSCLDMFPCPECVGQPRGLPSLPRLSLDRNHLVHDPTAAVLSLGSLAASQGPSCSLTYSASWQQLSNLGKAHLFIGSFGR